MLDPGVVRPQSDLYSRSAMEAGGFITAACSEKSEMREGIRIGGVCGER